MDIEPGLTVSVEPGLTFLAAAARAIVANVGDRLPNLSTIIVLLPNPYLAAPLQNELLKAVSGRAFLVPQFTTFDLWTRSVPIQESIVPESRRLAWIYNALRLSDFFTGLNRWQVATELLQLVNECSRRSIVLHSSEAEFERSVDRALGASGNRALQFEARVVHELWQALQRNTADGMDVHRAYGLRLSKLAAQATRPLFVVGLTETLPVEEAFLQAYSQRQPVYRIRVDARLSAGSEPLFALLDCAWAQPQPGHSLAPLLARATTFRQQFPVSPATKRVAIFPARSLEEEAHAVDMTVRRWLHEGKGSIAIVAQDRLTARRVRARLERGQILIADESGWTLSTTTASSVVMSWLTVVAGDFYHRDLFDFLRSPFVFADLPEVQRASAIAALDSTLRQANYVTGLNFLQQIVARVDLPQSVHHMVHRLVEAAGKFDGKSKPFAQWLESLLQSLDRLGAINPLSADTAGQDLLNVLHSLAMELQSETAVYSLAEWRRWLDQQLEQTNFRDRGIHSPVVITHLGLLDGRRFDGVIVLGADADHLPASSGNTLFNEAVLTQLGLPDHIQRRELERDRLMHLLSRAGESLVTWQAEKNGEKNAESSYWLRLQAVHRLAYGGTLLDADLVRLIAQAAAPLPAEMSQISFATARPQPRAAPLMPQSLSAAGYGSLLACPYQFYARHMLRLREEQEVIEQLEKRDYGDLVHRALAQFHQRFPVLLPHDESLLNDALHRISESVFESSAKVDFFARAWLLRWQRYMPAYITWQRKREEQGWRWRASEVSAHSALTLNNGASIKLKGRLDRIDQGADADALLDYKTASGDQLRRRVKDSSEDGQLAFYSLLAERPVAELAYVGLDDDPIVAYGISGDIGAIVASHRDRLQLTLSAMAADAALPAQGVDKVCEYCEVKGLCRKPYWRDDR